MNATIQESRAGHLLHKADIPFLVIDTRELAPELFYKRVLAEQAYFAPSRVILNNSDIGYVPDSRHSLTLMKRPLVYELAALVNNLISREHDHIRDVLSIEAFRKGPIFASCVVFQDGDFFRPHRDYDPKIIAKRKYTWVYYFHRDPKQFSGGKLVFYRKGHRIAEVDPYSGLLIVFRSDIVHEVERVTVPSRDFADGRFTLTGFVCESPTLLRRIMLKARRMWLKNPLVVLVAQFVAKVSRTSYRVIRKRFGQVSGKCRIPRA